MKNDDSLKTDTIKNMMWSFMDIIGSRAIQVIIQLFLARLLTPNDFGILGMVIIFIKLPEAFIESGFANGLIREKNSTQEDYSTVFYFNLITALILYFLLFISAERISIFFEVPELVNIIKVLGFVIVIDAFGLIQKVILRKKLEFKIQMRISLVSSLISGVIAIAFAIAGYGIWSLVIKIVVLQFLQAVLLSVTNKWIPSLTFNMISFKRLFNFGWKLVASNLLSEVYDGFYALIIGRGFSTVFLGYYTNARKLSHTACYSIAISVEKVSYPVLSNLQDDKVRLKSGFQKVLKNSIFINFPVMLGLAIIAPPLFRLILGNEWIPAIPYFQILCLAGMFTSIHAINLNMLQIKGRSDLFLKLYIYGKIIGFSIIGFVLLFELGVFGLLWGLVLESFISNFVNSFYSKKLISYSIFEQLKDIKLISFISVIMAILTYSLNYILFVHDLFLIVIQVIFGFILYILLSYIFKVEELETIYQIVKPFKKKLLLKKVM
ncbi:lipopolysaccharide biosynthesis protein [Alkalibacterium sp. f15]|uniref:lipopolysaccharide biosynthesis protein n=1 Tax=Alkalibacterium sp. f15 TaxID=3414029 RepID=UPI003BF8507C